jgi:hypothetical protein
MVSGVDLDFHQIAPEGWGGQFCPRTRFQAGPAALGGGDGMKNGPPALMKPRYLAAAKYAFAAAALGDYFDGFYGLDLSRASRSLLLAAQVSTAGMWLFAIAVVLSLFRFRFGVMCGLCACALAWPFFGRLLVGLPWRHLIDVLCCSDWADQYLAIMALITSTVYSLAQCWFWYRNGSSGS